jgi:hypothetical protein
MGSSKSDSYKEPKQPSVPADKQVAYGSTSPVIPPADAYTSYLTQGQTASGGVPVNVPKSGTSGALPAAASTASTTASSSTGRMSEIERINKLIAMGAAPRDILAILMAAKDPEPDDDIFFSKWGGGRG